MACTINYDRKGDRGKTDFSCLGRSTLLAVKCKAITVIRLCAEHDFELIWTIINDGASAYKGIIPEDRWKEPYMPKEDLQHEINEGVVFWGYEEAGKLIGVMGIQQLKT